jgi:hypothetical protein
LRSWLESNVKLDITVHDWLVRDWVGYALLQKEVKVQKARAALEKLQSGRRALDMTCHVTAACMTQGAGKVCELTSGECSGREERRW